MVGLCRLCASLRKMDVLITINNDSNDILEKLRVCCQIDIQMTDALPKSVCPSCLENLNSYHNFYRNVKEAQETLKTLFSSSSHDDSEKTKESTPQSMVKILTLPKENSKQKASELKCERTKLGAECKDHSEKSSNQIALDNDILGQTKCIMKGAQCHRNSNKVAQVKEDAVQSICASSSEKDINEVESIEEISESENDFNYWQIFEQQRQLMEESRDVHEINTTNPIYASNDDVLSDEALMQINDSEINLKVEYAENYKDDGKCDDVDSNEDIDHSFEKSSPALLPKLCSWKNYKFLCFICDNVFSTFIDLKHHMAKEHNTEKVGDFQFKCYDCKKILPTYHFFLNHIRLKHHHILKLKCDVCDISCQNFQELAYHRNVNCSGATNYAQIVACDECFKSFHNEYRLQNHVKYQHKKNPQYKCAHCQKEFRYQSCLKSHEQLHSDTKKFSCNCCDRSFTTKHSLERHQEYVHINAKTYQCNVCSKSYKNYQSLDDHQQQHTDNKRFKCQFCAKRFTQRNDKNAHERTHIEEMPYSCEECGKRFRHRSTLCRHGKFHSGCKPYSCEYCSKTFADSSNRNKHVRRIHLHCKSQQK